MTTDDGSDEIEAYTEALGICLFCDRGAEEFGEDLRDVFGFDADAVVMDGDDDTTTICRYSHLDIPAWWGIGDGIL